MMLTTPPLELFHTHIPMQRKIFYGLIGAAGLSLLVAIAFPLSIAVQPQATAQAQLPELAEGMTLARLDAVLKEEADEVQGRNGQWQIRVGDRALIVLADVNNNRMRIVSPAASASELDVQSIQNMLLANFHTALDARYAVSDNTVVALFVHPLNSLDEAYLRSALTQVITLADTFGTTYSSGAIGFGLSPAEPEGASGTGVGI